MTLSRSLQRALHPPADDFGGAGLAAEREHAHRDRGRGIVVAMTERRAGRVEHPHARAGFDRGGLDAIDRLREDPGIAAANRSVAALFEEDPSRRYRSAVRPRGFQMFQLSDGHRGSPARLKCRCGRPLYRPGGWLRSSSRDRSPWPCRRSSAPPRSPPPALPSRRRCGPRSPRAPGYGGSHARGSGRNSTSTTSSGI